MGPFRGWLVLAVAHALREGVLDCLGEKSEHGLRRAYRTMAKEFHPDKGGSEALTADLTSLRDSLVREPLKFQIFRAMFEGQLQPFSSLESTRVEVQLREGWPYLQVELDFDHGGLLLDGGSWTFAFGLKNGSTVHYRGDERSGGYDVCCDFVRDSQCQRHSLSRYNASTCQAEGECDSPYAASDCPLPARVMARVRRPLHQNVTGQWGGALQVKASSGEEVEWAGLGPALSSTRPSCAKLAAPCLAVRSVRRLCVCPPGQRYRCGEWFRTQCSGAFGGPGS
ncbi:unnamed protein product [Effrenium voratum]|nr:unnamed protein product [Effrenium voratum]